MEVKLVITLSDETNKVLNRLCDALEGRNKPLEAVSTKDEENIKEDVKPQKKTKKSNVAKDNEPEAKEEVEAEAEEETKDIDVSEVRTALVTAKRRLGSAKPIKDLIKSYGVQSVDELDPKYYAEIMAKAEEL